MTWQRLISLKVRGVRRRSLRTPLTFLSRRPTVIPKERSDWGNSQKTFSRKFRPEKPKRLRELLNYSWQLQTKEEAKQLWELPTFIDSGSSEPEKPERLRELPKNLSLKFHIEEAKRLRKPPNYYWNSFALVCHFLASPPTPSPNWRGGYMVHKSCIEFRGVILFFNFYGWNYKFLDLTSEKSASPWYGTNILGYFLWKFSTRKD